DTGAGGAGLSAPAAGWRAGARGATEPRRSLRSGGVLVARQLGPHGMFRWVVYASCHADRVVPIVDGARRSLASVWVLCRPYATRRFRRAGLSCRTAAHVGL